MAKEKMTDVLLERQWSGHDSGEIVTVEQVTAESMVRKNYGRIISASEKKKFEADQSPQIETATAPPQADLEQEEMEIERAIAPPQKTIKKDKDQSKKGR